MVTTKPARSVLGAVRYLTRINTIAGLGVGPVLVALALTRTSDSALLLLAGLLFALLGTTSLRALVHLREIGAGEENQPAAAGRRIKGAS